MKNKQNLIIHNWDPGVFKWRDDDLKHLLCFLI